MRVFFSPRQLAHAPASEFSRGEMIAFRECPVRAQSILAALAAAGFPAPSQPVDPGLAPVLAIHDGEYVEFLRTAWTRWRAGGATVAAYPTAWPVPGIGERRPDTVEGLLGWYIFDSGTPIVAETWDAVKAGADTAHAGALAVATGAHSAFALCRPPGHHAARALAGGYCYLNNAAIAAQTLRDQGAGRVAILDVDYHHGNGTQEIFYERGDVLFVSLHADPAFGYPYYTGYGDQSGRGAGEGTTLNLPLAAGTTEAEWLAALEHGLARLGEFAPDAVVVSLGVDTWAGDPLSHFKVSARAFPALGARLAGLGLPTLFVMEGGYATAELGKNVVGVLSGFEDA
ncbi:histone deacetylase family protein [Rhodospirillum rubrum]|uniref:Histone deacetylase superfamily n=1 Tax=Rhodospirillum rubrum (strain ATCC 11170 / ATH 1.1.1 / DSM 467 / LMG 4362 / NCIMB 8255 / S1) TaxID=269796 RepID=Q2RV68_RHORT|nr:histone deacetylase family protein [Rhodospirillum rubrum]ABC21977.1 Histone deacetylase superfamily [Rhodospirillum rubrum ATCC 11170]AEO47687.1 histone deacetylase superfamily protein [Rhodospirillum rubrum F11]MBK5953548.1 acetylpolyamine amidohydrolase [Rhodospirillum rubrum]QXG81634.1 histone deacetylase family protein [Rhodospirillum rubrum]HAP99659.1 histone deacetylase family protein [Rhodospirillum rubrum]